MAALNARMRLTIDVLPLTAENAHGPYRAQAMAAFKGRRFALPVQWEDTFARVWSQIEQRYKTNYLDAQQAAAFTIAKLQDAYDCDLDLRDTVSSIFEGETDPSMRLIKVVPSFVNRDFSVPATSNLRPAHAQKRLRDTDAEHANKRRRVEQQQLEDMHEAPGAPRDQPLPTTESERSGDDGASEARAEGARAGSRLTRSSTGASLLVVHDVHTGHEEFGPAIKEESPELGLPLAPKAAGTATADDTFKKPPVPRSNKSPSNQPSVPPPDVSEHQAVDEGLDVDASAPLAVTKRRDIYDVPSSPQLPQTSTNWIMVTSGDMAATLENTTLQRRKPYSRWAHRSSTPADIGSRSGPSPKAPEPTLSPTVARRPAHFLSRSPAPTNEKKDEGRSESKSSSESDDAEVGDEDIEMPNLSVEPSSPVSTANTNVSIVPSSPPRLANPPDSTPLVPETSQVAPSQINSSIVRKTPVPLPPRSQVRSSQPGSVQTAARWLAAGYGTLREQLADIKKKPTATQAEVLDPRTMNLGKLATRESSEEESSSSSSDSNSDSDSN